MLASVGQKIQNQLYSIPDSAAVAAALGLIVLLQSLRAQGARLLVGRFFWQLLGQFLEKLVNADILFGRDLEVLQALAACVILGLLGRHLAVVQIDLVADDNDENIGACLLVQLLDPLLALLKTIPTRDVENDARTDRIFVVHLRQGAVPFLPSRVPHLVLDDVIAQILVLREEATADRRLMSVGELAVSIPKNFRVRLRDQFAQQRPH